jgi:hypothetical protein
MVRTRCDLLLAHFAASHFRVAKQLMVEIQPNFVELNNVNHNLRALFSFDSAKLYGYKAALLGAPKSKTKRQKVGFLLINCFYVEFLVGDQSARIQ